MTGTRAMNGEARRATTAMKPMADRQPGSARAARTPSTIRRPSSSRPGWRAGAGSRTSRRATTTAPNEAALIPKTTA